MYHNRNVTASIPYLQDKLIWCIQRSGKIPIWVNFFFIIPLDIWIFFAFVSVLSCSFLMYALLPFETYYRSKIHRFDFSYCLCLIIIPSYAATSSTFRPKNPLIRLYYGMLLICPMLFHQLIGAFMYQFMHHQFYYHQIASTDEMITKNFRLTGSSEVLNAIKYNTMVFKNRFSNAILI